MSCAYLQEGNAFHFNDHNDNKNKGRIIKKLVLLAILVLSAVFVFAQQPPACIKVKVRPSIDGKAAEGVTVRLFQGNNEQIRIDSTDNRFVTFTLERDQDYTIELSEQGRFTRRVSISTHLPEEMETKPLFRYVMDVELPPSLDLGDDFYMDFPIAMIAYNENKDRFEHNKRYTAHIKAKMEQHRVQSLIVTK